MGIKPTSLKTCTSNQKYNPHFALATNHLIHSYDECTGRQCSTQDSQLNKSHIHKTHQPCFSWDLHDSTLSQQCGQSSMFDVEPCECDSGQRNRHMAPSGESAQHRSTPQASVVRIVFECYLAYQDHRGALRLLSAASVLYHERGTAHWGLCWHPQASKPYVGGLATTLYFESSPQRRSWLGGEQMQPWMPKNPLRR